jgi:AraC family transcriptional regulator, activator of mtrCDE
MDALSRLLALYPVRTALDIRCHFGAPWRLEEAAVESGIAPYHLIVAGTAWLDVAGQRELALQAGDIVVLPHGSAHSLHTGRGEPVAPVRELEQTALVRVKGNDGTGPATDILCGQFHFDAGPSNALLKALPALIVVRTAGRADFAGLQALIAMLRGEAEAMRPGASAVVGPLASALFALLMRAWLEQADAVPGLFAVLAQPRLQAALHAMLAQPAHPWSVAQLAERCHMSRATFARLFREAAGATPGEVLMRTRMAQAAQWLSQGRQAVPAIGEAVGYQSEAAFNRVFKRCFGVGPGGYRRAARLATPG